MESDFTTRNHLDSVNLGDPALFELLNRYKASLNSPQSIPQPPPFAPPFQSPLMGTFPVAMGGNADSLILSNMMGRLQSDLEKSKTSELGGLQLSVNSDILKWVILLLIVAIFVWVILKIRRTEGSGLEDKVRRMQRQLRKMRKNPPSSQEDSAEDTVEDPVDSED